MLVKNAIVNEGSLALFNYYKWKGINSNLIILLKKEEIEKWEKKKGTKKNYSFIFYHFLDIRIQAPTLAGI